MVAAGSSVEKSAGSTVNTTEALEEGRMSRHERSLRLSTPLGSL